MHDYHKAKEMVEYAETKAADLGKTKVTRVYLRVGESSGYSAESILMYFAELSEGTVCADASVVITNVKPMLVCPSCGKVFPRKLMPLIC